MSRFGGFPQDNNPDRTDKLLGTQSEDGSSKNYNLGDLIDFFSQNVVIIGGNRYLSFKDEGQFTQSIVRDDTEFTRVGYLEPSTEGIELSSPNIITIPNFFLPTANTVAAAQGRIIIFNATTSRSTAATISSYGAGTIITADPLPGQVIQDAQNGATSVLFLINPSVVVEGNLTVMGNISGNITANRVANGNPLDSQSSYEFWVGLESQFQTIVNNNEVDDSLIYFRLDG